MDAPPTPPDEPLDFTLRFLDIEGESWSWNIKLKQPLIRTRAMNWWVYGQFSWQNTTNDVLTATISDDRLRVFRYGTTFEVVDAIMLTKMS